MRVSLTRINVEDETDVIKQKGKQADDFDTLLGKSRKPKLIVDEKQKYVKKEKKVKKNTDDDQKGIFHPEAFKNKTVFINVGNAEIKERVKSVLTMIESEFVDFYQPLVEIVVSDTHIDLPKPSAYKSRGEKMMEESSKKSFVPILVLLSQIPWVFHTQRKESIIVSPVDDTENMIIVCDATAKHAPIFKKFDKLPRLYCDPIPEGLSFPAFSKPPSNPSDWMKKRIKNGNKKERPTGYKADEGFCEICQVKYLCSQLHRQKYDHINNQKSGIWADFDSLAEGLQKEPFV